MRNVAKELDERLEQLLLDKPYSSLTEQETCFVLSHIDKVTYQSMRQSLLVARSVYKVKPAPSMDVKKNLKRILAEKREQGGWFSQLRPLLYYRVPAWQVAVSFCVILLSFLFPWTKSGIDSTNHSIISLEADTVLNVLPTSTKVMDENVEDADTPSVSGVNTFKASVLDTMEQIVENIQTILPDTTPIFLASVAKHSFSDSVAFPPDSFSLLSQNRYYLSRKTGTVFLNNILR